MCSGFAGMAQDEAENVWTEMRWNNPERRGESYGMRKYASKYIKPDNVRDGPIQTRIVNVFESEQYGRPVLELETGSQFTLNEGNTNILIKAWGYETDNWIGQEIELELGHL